MPRHWKNGASEQCDKLPVLPPWLQPAVFSQAEAEADASEAEADGDVEGEANSDVEAKVEPWPEVLESEAGEAGATRWQPREKQDRLQDRLCG